MRSLLAAVVAASVLTGTCFGGLGAAVRVSRQGVSLVDVGIRMPGFSPQRPTGRDFGTFGGQEPVAAGVTVTVLPVVTTLSDGATETTYSLPDGEVITTVTPPIGFDPVTADISQLQELDFPLPPSDADGLAEWTAAMSAYKSDTPPTGPLQVVVDPAVASSSFSTYYGRWAGYADGALFTQSHTYVAVKAVFYVPSNSGTCHDDSPYYSGVGFWIGLGGTGGSGNDLVQQGFECGSHYVGTGSSYRAFTEFADTAFPKPFCLSSWILSAGDKTYQNMSFQTSSNTAHFYLEDQTTGATRSCANTAPTGWAWDLNTAEWIAEAPQDQSVDFGSVRFTDAHAQLSSNSSWVTLGSQTHNTFVDGTGPAPHDCIAPGGIGSDSASFTDSWIATNCY